VFRVTGTPPFWVVTNQILDVHVNVKEAKLHQLPVVRVLDDKRITFFGSIV
jgi:hypothetical protein